MPGSAGIARTIRSRAGGAAIECGSSRDLQGNSAVAGEKIPRCYAEIHARKVPRTEMQVENSRMQLKGSEMQVENSQMQLKNLEMHLENSQMQVENSEMQIGNSWMQIPNSGLQSGSCGM